MQRVDTKMLGQREMNAAHCCGMPIILLSAQATESVCLH
jgi:hypothetical protein